MSSYNFHNSEMEPTSALKERFPGRESQIDQLYNLIGHTDEPYVDSVYVYGGPGVGKSSVVTQLLEACRIKCAVVNLIECYTTKILLETALNKLSGHRIDPQKGLPYAKCDNLMEFLFALSRLDINKAVIVLDKAEQLRNMDANLLAGFLRFPEISGLPISVIFISELPFQKYYATMNTVEPIKIHFPAYNKDELFSVLFLDYEERATELITKENFKFDADFYKNYLNLFLSVFYRACRGLTELRYMSRLNFVSYCRPIINNECDVTNSLALWKNISPILKSSLDNLYLRVTAKSGEPSQGPRTFAFSKENLAQSWELPFYAKYLLIAAYLASYNPVKDDKRLFVKGRGKKRKTMRDVKAKSKVSEQLNTQLGPKAFNFDRLLAIFYAILDDKIAFNSNLLVQISSLVELQLLNATSNACNLDGQKYKCAVNFDFIQTIAKMVGFNIRKYLSDFSHM